jgi:hypothetical protein
MAAFLSLPSAQPSRHWAAINELGFVNDHWDAYEGLNAGLGAPAAPFELDPRYHRKAVRSMGRVALMATRASESAP